MPAERRTLGRGDGGKGRGKGFEGCFGRSPGRTVKEGGGRVTGRPSQPGRRAARDRVTPDPNDASYQVPGDNDNRGRHTTRPLLQLGVQHSGFKERQAADRAGRDAHSIDERRRARDYRSPWASSPELSTCSRPGRRQSSCSPSHIPVNAPASGLEPQQHQ